MTHNTWIVFEAILSVLVPIFLLLILQGNFISPTPIPDTVYSLSNLSSPVVIAYTGTPHYLIYDITTQTPGCFVGNIPQFSHCGFATQCTGRQKISLTEPQFVLRPSETINNGNSSRCYDYVGNLRITYKLKK